MGGKIRFIVVAIALASSFLAGCSSSDLSAPTSTSTETSAEPSAHVSPDPYTQPADIKAFIAGVKPSLVLIVCGRAYGTGWVINTASPPVLRKGKQRTFPEDLSSLVITNDHVIRRCLKDRKKKFLGYLQDREVELAILNTNRKDDVALLEMNVDAPGLQAIRKPDQGTWAMALGFPLDFEYPVPLMGSVIDALNDRIVLQMPSQPGNSGSPVLNADGRVTGTLSFTYLDGAGGEAMGWSKASSTQTLCLHLFDCTKVPITQTTQ